MVLYLNDNNPNSIKPLILQLITRVYRVIPLITIFLLLFNLINLNHRVLTPYIYIGISSLYFNLYFLILSLYNCITLLGCFS